MRKKKQTGCRARQDEETKEYDEQESWKMTSGGWNQKEKRKCPKL